MPEGIITISKVSMRLKTKGLINQGLRLKGDEKTTDFVKRVVIKKYPAKTHKKKSKKCTKKRKILQVKLYEFKYIEPNNS